jgi:hypothetical protein
LNHQVTLVDTKQLADGIVAVQACCCGDQNSLSWLTMASEVAIDPVRREDSIALHVNRVAQLHETTLQALSYLPTLVGTVTTVSFPSEVPDPAPAEPAPDPQPVPIPVPSDSAPLTI